MHVKFSFDVIVLKFWILKLNKVEVKNNLWSRRQQHSPWFWTHQGFHRLRQSSASGSNNRNWHRQLAARFLETSRPVLQPCSSDSSNPEALKTLRHLITSSSVQDHGFHSSCSDINAPVHRGSMHMEFKGYLLPYQTTYLIRLLLLRSNILNVSLICLRSWSNRWLWAYSNIADLRRLFSPHHESASPVWWVDLWFPWWPMRRPPETPLGHLQR